MTVTEFLIRLHGDHLTPDYQPGDALTVRDADTAHEGQLAVVVTNADGDVGVRRYNPADGLRVIGVVTGMNRRIPGGAR